MYAGQIDLSGSQIEIVIKTFYLMHKYFIKYYIY